MLFSTQQVLALNNTQSALMGVVQGNVQPGWSWENTPHTCLPTASPSCEPQEQGSCRGNMPLLTSSQLGNTPGFGNLCCSSLALTPSLRLRVTPRGCGNEQKGGEWGGTQAILVLLPSTAEN